MSEQKKALQLASVASMIDQFNIPNIKILLDLGYKVDVVADFTHPGTITNERAEDLKRRLNDMGVRVIDIAIPRSLNPRAVTSAYKQVKKLITSEHYNLIHCHSPIGGVICRQAAKSERKKGTKVIYTAHGFHFYDGAPLKNWIVFYPIEKWYSRFTDVLITINKEDYNRASEKFKAKKVVKIPGVGVDTDKFAVCKVDRAAKRAELGLKDTDFLLFSVGELSERNNQKITIEALGKMKSEDAIGNIVYLVVGRGDLQGDLEQLIKDYDLVDHVRLLGFRTDIDELCEIVDCFVHSSIKEGLGIAPLEAMAAGLPLIFTDVNCIKDYTEDGVLGCCVNPTDVAEMISAIKRMRDDEDFRNECASNNYKSAQVFDVRNTDEIMKLVCGGGYRHLRSIVVRQIKREELGLKNDDFVVITVGELNDNKNQQVVIKAVSKLSKNAKYVIVGKGPLEKELHRLADEVKVAERIIFTGYRTDIKELLWMSDCFAFPSKREGLGLAAIEAMAAGLPIVTSNAGGIIDYSKNGETGYVVYSSNEIDYSNAIMMLIKDKRNVFKQRVQDVAAVYDKKLSNGIMADVYRNI